eukprot:TRINITY_DN3890_c0_g1_i2.p1 TRINITY_DN3890_c0_g1~~TRINITY_DN3890_c0_g1_i2.p1  ORF type:complete len:281 (+),score=48.43 TRINITY_DN3890_c0_g1_i2:106-843(+)
MLPFFSLLLLILGSSFCVNSSIIDLLNNLVKAKLPDINTEIHNVVPHSYGDCNSNSPPQPCACSSGCSNLYYIHKAWEYKAYARWISGLDTGQLTSVVFSVPTPLTVEVDIKGVFGSLPLSLWIGECFTFDQCLKLWDNTEGCCGSNKHFEVQASLFCNNTFPYLRSAQLNSLYLDDLEITEKIIGISINIQDITNSIKTVVSGLLTDYLSTQRFINLNGTQVTLLDFLNYQIHTHLGAFKCPTA